MFTLVMLAEDKRGHQDVLPPIGPQDIEQWKGRFIEENTHWGDNISGPSLPPSLSFSQTNCLIKHELHECSLAASACLDIPICASTVNLSRRRSKHKEAICKSDSAFNDTGNHPNLLKARRRRRGRGLVQVSDQKCIKLPPFLACKRAWSTSDFKWWAVSRWTCGRLIARDLPGCQARLHLIQIT